MISVGLAVARPIEAYPQRGIYLVENDVMRDEVFDGVMLDIECGYLVYIHFGLTDN